MKLYFGIVLILFVAICSSQDPDQSCTYGQTKMEACNYCQCLQNGEWACTKMECSFQNAGCVTGDVVTMEGVSCVCLDNQYICEN